MQFNKYVPKDWDLIKPTDVEIVQLGSSSFEAVIDKEFTIPIPKKSSIGGQLILGTGSAAIIDQFKDGSYFVVDDTIVDFRLKDDLKFVHDHKSVQELIDRIGFVTAVRNKDISRRVPQRGGRNSILSSLVGRNRILTQSCTESFEFNQIDKIGGQFDISIGFAWSPFTIDITSTLDMLRMVCDNLATMESSVMNAQIPMINQWEDNMNVANEVIRHNFNKLIGPRLEAMPTERVTLEEVNIMKRLTNALMNLKELDVNARDAVEVIQTKLDQAWHPSAAQLQPSQLRFIPAPITSYDMMNVATEAYTHYVPNEETSLAKKFQGFVSRLMFDSDHLQRQVNIESLITDTQTFENTDRAFFGETCH